MSLKTNVSNRRTHFRKPLHAPVHVQFEQSVSFPGSQSLFHSNWACIDLGQGGMLLEAKEPTNKDTAKQFEWLQNTLFPKGKGKGGHRIYHPALPPEKLQVSVELHFPRKKNSFMFHGVLAWFRHLAKGVYRMGVRFDEGQDLHIYQDRSGQVVISTLWRESDL